MYLASSDQIQLFRFKVVLLFDSTLQPPTVKCHTRIWHPNISEDGKICLSILREHSVDGTGWAPTRRMKDVIWGLSFLFTVSYHYDHHSSNFTAHQHVSELFLFVSMETEEE